MQGSFIESHLRESNAFLPEPGYPGTEITDRSFRKPIQVKRRSMAEQESNRRTPAKVKTVIAEERPKNLKKTPLPR